MSKKVGSIFLLGVFLWMSHGYGALCSVAEILDAPLVVNLARAPERFEVTKGWMELAGFTNIQRWEGVDGYNTDEAFFRDLKIFFGSPGEKGCAASHLMIWKAFAESEDDREFLFIAEDDMLPHSRFAELFPIYWAQTPEDFDFVLVGNSFKRSLLRSRPELSSPLILRCPAWCTHAYILSKKGARRLLHLYQHKRRPVQAIDAFLKSVVRNCRVNGYCYNGTMYPEENEPQKSLIIRPLDTGICFQNSCLERSILSRYWLPPEEQNERMSHF